MLRYKMKVSRGEKDLAEAVAAVGHGEIFSVKPKQEARDEIIELSANMNDLLELLRKGVEISIITIHQGEPVWAEVDEIIEGFRCRKKVKFPTV